MLFAGMLAPHLKAQASYGTVTGTVRNTTGAPMADVKIELENVATGTRVTVATDAQGAYRFENVPAGRYRIITTHGKVAAVPSPEFDVAMNRTNIMNVTITPGPATDVITVLEEPARVLETAQIITYYEAESIQNLPRPNFVERTGNAFGAYNLSLLSEGVTSGGVGEATGPAVTGHRPSFNIFHIDGIDNKNRINNAPVVYMSNMATKDFVLLEDQSAPRFGHEPGGKLNSTVHSGTNGIHGALYNYLQNRIMNALEPAWIRQGITDQPRYDQNRLGGAVGFPILRNHLFFYGNFEWIPLGFTRPGVSEFLAPTTEGLATLSTVPGVSQQNISLLQPFATTQAPTSSTIVNGVSIPLAPVSNLFAGSRDSYMGTGSIEWLPSDRQRLQGRYVYNYVNEQQRNVGLPNQFVPTKARSMLGTIAHYYTVNPNITNELRVGYNRWDQNVLNDFFSTPFLNIGGTNLPNAGFGFVTLAGFAAARNNIQNGYDLADTLAWQVGRHNLRFGFDGRRFMTTWRQPFGLSGNYVYSNLQEFALDLTPGILAQRTFGADQFGDDQWSYFLFAQDMWRVAPTLSVDLGVSWQYSTIPNSIERLFGSNGPFSGLDSPSTQKTAFAPRVGFAWAPGNRNTVFRAGFGMQWDTITLNALNPLLFPFGVTAVSSGTTPAGGFLATGGVQNPFVGTPDITAPFNAGVFNSTILGDQRLPYYMTWNAGLQHSFWRGFLGEVRYLGTKGTNLPWITNVNPIATSTSSLPVFFTAPSQATLDTLPTFAQLQAGSFLNGSPLVVPSFTGNSTYHALAVNLTQRFIKGVQFAGHYTYSHLIDDSNGTTFDLANPDRSSSSSIFDRRHRGTATVLWDVAGAFGDQPSLLRNILANFVIAATYTYESAQYLPLVGGLAGSLWNQTSIVNPASAVGASLSTPLFNTAGGLVGYLADPTARFITTGPGVLSTGSRGFLIPLDVMNNLDVSVSKGFAFRDLFNVEVRGTAYNILNTSQFVGGPINTIDFRTTLQNPAFQTAGTGAVQNFQQSFSSNPRLLQVSLRILF